MAARLLNLPVLKDPRLAPIIDRIIAKLLSTSENTYKCANMLSDFFGRCALVQVLRTAQETGEVHMGGQMPFITRDNMNSTGFATVDEIMSALNAETPDPV